MSAEQPLTDSTLPLGETWGFKTDDALFRQPYVDTDERQLYPVPHRYVHGGFRDTDTRFSFYFPDADAYGGRFFQHVTPFPQSEFLAQEAPVEHNKISFANASGAYFVESNGGGAAAGDPTSGVDPLISAYRANAAVARFSRLVAERIFGPHRVYGYLYGGSGGGYRTISGAENTSGAWDGYVPHVIGSSMAIPNVFSVRMHAQRILRDKFPAIVDAFDAGGDPSSLDLTEEESSALEEVTRMGFPPRSWFGWKTMGMHAFSVLYPGVMQADPTFSADFWNEQGYLGTDPIASVHRDRVQLDTTITELIAAASPDTEATISGGVDESFKAGAQEGGDVVSVRLAATPDAGWMLGAQLMVRSGASAGAVLQVAGVEADIAHLEPGRSDILADLAIGDEVTLDNSSFLAVQTYHRHQVPGPDFAVWDQFRRVDGSPIYPQRSMLLGPIISRGASGTVQSGKIADKMIVVASLLDREAFPWQADWYRTKVAEHLVDGEDEMFRLWYVDNALHGDDGPQEFPARSVAYLGALETALRQVAAWVEDDIEPWPSTSYEIIDGQVIIPERVGERGGVQPVATLTVDGRSRTNVRVGEPVEVRIQADAAGTGVITEIVEVLTAEDGSESFAEPFAIQPASRVAVTDTRTFDKPGTHFLAVRVTEQTEGDIHTAHARVDNVTRARVVVES